MYVNHNMKATKKKTFLVNVGLNWTKDVEIKATSKTEAKKIAIKRLKEKLTKNSFVAEIVGELK